MVSSVNAHRGRAGIPTCLDSILRYVIAGNFDYDLIIHNCVQIYAIGARLKSSGRRGYCDEYKEGEYINTIRGKATWKKSLINSSSPMYLRPVQDMSTH